MKRIKAILFDLDGTLRHHIPNGGDVFVEYARSIGLRISEEDRIRSEHWTHHYFANSLEIQSDEKMHKGNLRGFWLNFTKRRLVALGLHSTQASELAPKISAYMDEHYKPEVHIPHDTYNLLEFLKSSGYILGVVSNRGEPYSEELKKINMDGFFKFSLAGGEVNSYKPDRVIFERALDMAGTSAQETMYVGDNYFADVVGARRAGLMPVLYDPISLFADADCAVIKSFAELPDLLKKNIFEAVM
ncbi:MAG: HAD family hydrolase [Chloroflexi bacterium]|nr:HAD family hydrolase [Chloroflexota bacterium]